MQSIKKWMVLTLCLVLMATMVPLAGFAAGPNDFSDMPNDWSTPALKKAVENGLLTGSNGMIMPKSNLTRAQMAAILVRAFGANKLVNVSMFTDINTSQWYFKDISKAYAMGIFQGTGDKMNPEKYITREEVFTVLARALNLDPGKETSNWKFRDSTEISSWAKTSVAAMIEAGYISGSGGMLNPKANMTRAEFAALMDRIAKYYIRKEGTYTGTYDGSVMITVPGVILKDVTINGDLIIGDGVGDGEIILENVTILGRTIVRGLAQLVEGTDIEDENVALGPGGIPGPPSPPPGPNPPNPPNPPTPEALITYKVMVRKNNDAGYLLVREIDANQNKVIRYSYFEDVYNANTSAMLEITTKHDDFITRALSLVSPSGSPYALSLASRVFAYEGVLQTFNQNKAFYEAIVKAGNATTSEIQIMATDILSHNLSDFYSDLALLYPASEGKKLPDKISIKVISSKGNYETLEGFNLSDMKSEIEGTIGNLKLNDVMGKDIVSVTYANADGSKSETITIYLEEVSRKNQ